MDLAKHIAALAALGLIQGCTLLKPVVHNYPDLDDHRIFANCTIERAGEPSALRRGPGTGLEVAGLEQHLEKTRTVAYVVLHDERAGQYLYINPRSRTVIVKFSEQARQDPVPVFRAAADKLRGEGDLALRQGF